MQRPLTVLCVVLALVPAILLLEGCGKEDLPVVSVTPNSYDFGRVRHGQMPVAKFVIRNNSDQPVTIAQAKPNCHCFRYKAPKDSRLDPGTETTFSVILDSGSVPPQQLRGKNLQISTTHPEMRSIVIALEGTIFAPASVEVENGYDKLYFGRIGSDKSYVPRKLFIRKAPAYSVSLDTTTQRFPDGYAFEPPHLKEIFDVTVEPSKSGYDVAVKLKEGAEPKRPGHQLTGSITFALKAKGPDMPEDLIWGSVKIHGTWP